ncbi:MAG: iron-containing alcohol dehydrogenase family protein [Phototrophicaceae bacterium]|jgi:alcohol dehydrogenase class IV
MKSFEYVLQAQKIVFAVGALAQLPAELQTFGLQRVMLITTPHLTQNGHVARVQGLLGERLVAVYDQVEPHVPDYQLEECLKIASAKQIDGVIGLGGGSPIGMMKALSLGLEAVRSGVEQATAKHSYDQPLVPTIAIPTTYAGSEMTPVYGVTRIQEDGSTRKVTVQDYKITPKLTLYDPELTLNLPGALTASTGINALAHCIESVYSATRNPLSTAAALLGIRNITRSLLTCYQEPNNLDARIEMFIGSHMGGTCLSTVVMGVHHGTCHVLGGTAGVPHGVANSIILPHAIRFNSDQLGGLIAMAGEQMGIARDGKTDTQMAEATADAVYTLVSQLHLPQRLRDADVPESLLPKLAETMLKSKAVASNPKPVSTFDEAMSILQAAW